LARPVHTPEKAHQYVVSNGNVFCGRLRPSVSAHQLFVLVFTAWCYTKSAYCYKSVCPSVTLRNRDHAGWNIWKIISQLVFSLVCSFVAWVGYEKVDCRHTNPPISLKRLR